MALSLTASRYDKPGKTKFRFVLPSFAETPEGKDREGFKVHLPNF